MREMVAVYMMARERARQRRLDARERCQQGEHAARVAVDRFEESPVGAE